MCELQLFITDKDASLHLTFTKTLFLISEKSDTEVGFVCKQKQQENGERDTTTQSSLQSKQN